MRCEDQRLNMVQSQIIARGIKAENVINAFLKIPRHLFVPPEIRHLAYRDSPLKIGAGQTISQPYIVALMTELLDVEKNHKILDIGTGSGYQTAILAELGKIVYTVERIETLSRSAGKLLAAIGYENISYHIGDGTLGVPEFQPYDRIVVTAAAPDIPDSLLDQLAPNGKLVIPAGSRFCQDLILIEKVEDGFRQTNHGGCTFVPLIGKEGWHEI
ncbi:MAG: protein-L-isoaspartate(D-aspartate) O-methyltransferase [Candidatus Cloacimonetes bacterium]|nr:protein-L-isoaspartate(D-aspartate) O-methyltransferase [Candidatus Cloacimonadota bacterium]